MIDYTLIRSRRETVALYIRDGMEILCGSVEVRVPLWIPKSEHR